MELRNWPWGTVAEALRFRSLRGRSELARDFEGRKSPASRFLPKTPCLVGAGALGSFRAQCEQCFAGGGFFGLFFRCPFARADRLLEQINRDGIFARVIFAFDALHLVA